MRAATRGEPIILSWSGGKDSALALESLRAAVDVEVVALLTTVTREYDRISIHGVRRELLHAQARALGLPLIETWLEPRSSNEAYERALGESLALVRAEHPHVHRIAFGDLFLEDVRFYREATLGALGFGCLFPLWGTPTDSLARDFIARGYSARLICVDTQSLDARFAGRVFDDALLAELPAGVDPCGERGEFHTFVSQGPGFRVAVPYSVGETVLRDGRFSYTDLTAVGCAGDLPGVR
jgi:uncharacterized protein (TIGR00290 family)